MNGKAVMRGHNETTAEMESAFSNQVGHPVTDGMGLKGRYDYTVYCPLQPAALGPRRHRL